MFLLQTIFKDELKKLVDEGLIKEEETVFPDLGEIPDATPEPTPVSDDEEDNDEEDEDLSALIQDVDVITSGTLNPLNSMCYYVAGNNASYATTYDKLACENTTFGVMQGPASSGEHGVAAAAATGRVPPRARRPQLRFRPPGFGGGAAPCFAG